HAIPAVDRRAAGGPRGSLMGRWAIINGLLGVLVAGLLVGPLRAGARRLPPLGGGGPAPRPAPPPPGEALGSAAGTTGGRGWGEGDPSAAAVGNRHRGARPVRSDAGQAGG